MDLNADGNIDILSGSYSRQGQSMAGTFQVLWGNKDGTFRKAEELKGSDGEPLVIPNAGDDEVVDSICTRPFAVDIDGDGKLDIVTGNFRGSFAVFAGEGAGKFQPKPTWLEDDGGKLMVGSHSDPFFVDWDKDGDLDMLSGSSEGGVFLFKNTGDKKKPKFGAKQTLLEAVGHSHRGDKLGDAHVTKPSSATRVWADDVNGDGKLDLLIGDQIMLVYPKKGADEAKVKKQLAEWEKKQQELFESNSGNDEASQKKINDGYKALQKEREAIVTDDNTGFVWLMLQK